MNGNQEIYNKIAEALLIDYTSVYYVNAVTNEYVWYSADNDYHSLCIEQSGRDFFVNLVRDAEKVIYKEDLHIFTRDITKEKLLAQMERGGMQNIEYRLMIEGKPVYHTLRLIRGPRQGDDYFILGVLNIDEEVRRRQNEETLEKERHIYNQITESLAEHYDTLYYVDTETNDYFEVSSSDVYKSMEIKPIGSDFFSESEKNLKKFIHPDDKKRILPLFTKKGILNNLKNTHTFTLTYRLVIMGKVMNVRCSQIWASDRRHIIICIENINDEVSAQHELIESRRKSITYGQIAESLASHYDVIYYIDSVNGDYVEFTANSIYGSLEVKEEGNDFFSEAPRNIEQIVFPDDKDRMHTVIDKDYLISALEDKKQFAADYRLVIDGKTRYTRMTVTWAGDKVHLIIGVENIDEEIKREKEQIKALNQANELARRDELTGTRNKTAYHELEQSIQHNIESGIEVSDFAIIVCDINGLKEVNDTKGHKAGDEYIRSASRLICRVFSHSPVFRIGGDEFAVYISGDAFSNREVLLDELHTHVLENIKKHEGAIIAAGMASFDPDADIKIGDVFNRADTRMYENKKRLKELAQSKKNNGELDDLLIPITDDRLKMLDNLFEAFNNIAGGAYIFVCDMKYDYSRWSKSAVVYFDMPGEYMYNAGVQWGEHIHPDDRDTYLKNNELLFMGSLKNHDMQYRVRKSNGDYDVCTCRGVVMRDKDNLPDFFCGTIRNHSILGELDTLTGLRNQYGFFEDIQTALIAKKTVHIILIGISRFSEINEIYGYSFGNQILQRFGRFLFQKIGNDGAAYRLDGTKFAIISPTRTLDESKRRYSRLRALWRSGTPIENRSVILDLNAGFLTVDNFNVDHRTVYACLNYAYSESKLKRHGDLVEFRNDIGDDNKHRLEKLHAIRASIMQEYKGFYLLYQPVVDSHTEKLIGAEALLRWRSDEYGMVPPDHFIPLLEKDPLFPELGEWIIKKALSDAKKIIEAHPDFMINVNLSYTQLEKPDFVDMVLRQLEQSGYAPEHLCFEITERCRLLDMDLLKNITVNLRGRGVKIALDDFGTGFSSIGIVKNLPFDFIKIDRSFVRSIEEDNKERELIKSIAVVASTFGAEVCIEGIETEGMRDILQSYNVHSFQGYYYAKPLPFEEFIKWNEDRN
ncbi:MAG: EAL domain-containing protein [Ruminococcus sp.]|nr:EAL domain-containing protein [Ruminococcus sp.]